jgi:hypothetical protein
MQKTDDVALFNGLCGGLESPTVIECLHDPTVLVDKDFHIHVLLIIPSLGA